VFTVRTDQLLIRELQAQDQSIFCELFTDSGTMRFIGPALRPEQAIEQFGRALRSGEVQPRKGFFWTVVESRISRPIGICSLRIEHTRAEAGLMLRSDHRLKGYGLETVQGLFQASFQVFPIDEIWVQYGARNLAAERLFAKAGLGACSDECAGTHTQMRVRSAFREHWETQISGHLLQVTQPQNQITLA